MRFTRLAADILSGQFMTQPGGWPNAMNAANVAKDVFAKRPK
jgi:hypothetical protein